MGNMVSWMNGYLNRWMQKCLPSSFPPLSHVQQSPSYLSGCSKSREENENVVTSPSSIANDRYVSALASFSGRAKLFSGDKRPFGFAARLHLGRSRRFRAGAPISSLRSSNSSSSGGFGNDFIRSALDDAASLGKRGADAHEVGVDVAGGLAAFVDAPVKKEDVLEFWLSI